AWPSASSARSTTWAGPSAVTGNEEAGQGGESSAGGPQRVEVIPGLPAQALGAATALGRAQGAGVGQLAARRVLLHPLAGPALAALRVEQVVRNLEGQPEAPPVAVEPFQQLGARAVGPFPLSRQSAQPQA